MKQKGFTLIELLVVIAIIAILSVVVILTLNPAELLRQSRDSSRVSDLATMSDAIGLYSEDVGGSIGTASTTYATIPSASTTCASVGLPALASGLSWNCTPSSTYRKIDGTGWLPLNLKSLSSGSPLGALPIDPVNQSSSNLFYTYTAVGTQYELTAVLESQKQRLAFEQKPISVYFPGVDMAGSSLSASGLYSPSGLVAYWNFDEGSGITAFDQSGNGNNGTWGGTPSGIGGTYYSAAKVGAAAGFFDGSTDYLSIGSNASLNITGNITISAWVKTAISAYDMILGGYNLSSPYNGYGFGINVAATSGAASYWDGTTWVGANTAVNDGNWHFVAVSVNGSTANFYTDGLPDGSPASGPPNSFAGTRYIGNSVAAVYSGSIDDLRIYSRALSAAEILGLYNAEK